MNPIPPVSAVAPPASKVTAMIPHTRTRATRVPKDAARSSPSAMEFKEPDKPMEIRSPTATKGATIKVSSRLVRAMEPRPQLRILSKASGSMRVKKVVTPPQHRSQCHAREYQGHGVGCSTNCTNEVDQNSGRGCPDEGKPNVARHTANAEYSDANGDGKACASVNTQNSGVS